MIALDLPRYLLGIAEIGLLAGFAWWGATQLRRRLLPEFAAAPAHLATAVLALALLLWAAELLGAVGLFEPLPYLAGVALAAVAAGALSPRTAAVRDEEDASLAGGVGVGWTRRARRLWSARHRPCHRTRPCSGAARRAAEATPPRRQDPRAWTPRPATLIALAIAIAAAVHFAAGVRLRLDTGMTGFDSTWYHGPFAAGFFQSGDTWDLHFVAPQFLAWFYPANAEVFHAAGMLAFGRDVLSPLLNLGWFVGCLVAAWCIGRPFGAAPGRPFGVAPWSLALGAVALSVPALADQAGEARNDIVGIFFLLAAVAIALNAWSSGDAPRDQPSGDAPRDTGPGDAPRNPGPGDAPGDSPRVRSCSRIPGTTANALGALAVSGLAAGLAAGTKLNFLPPAAVLVVGLALVAPAGARWRALATTGLAALAGGGYWYLRNLVHTGNPLPWVDGVGPLSLPAPDQALGGREGHSVLGYLTDGAVWSDWLLPGLHDGLWFAWPLLVGAALAGLALCVAAPGLVPTRSRPSAHTLAARASAGASSPTGPAQPGLDRTAVDADLRPLLAVAGLTGLAALLAWLVAPTSASGPDSMPRGFESGLRYLSPALVLGLALLPIALTTRFRRDRRSATAPLPRVAPGWGGLAEPGGCGALGPVPAAEPVPVAEQRAGPPRPHHTGDRTRGPAPPHRNMPIAAAALVLLVAIAIGYPVQRHYLHDRYSDPAFTSPGLNVAFAWARDVTDARIATTATRQYPLFGADLSNDVQFVGLERPHGGFTPPTTCRQWRRLLNQGDYDYAIASRDRLEPGKPPYPPSAAWTAGPGATPTLRTPPTAIFQLSGLLDPSACP